MFTLFFFSSSWVCHVDETRPQTGPGWLAPWTFRELPWVGGPTEDIRGANDERSQGIVDLLIQNWRFLVCWRSTGLPQNLRWSKFSLVIVLKKFVKIRKFWNFVFRHQTALPCSTKSTPVHSVLIVGFSKEIQELTREPATSCPTNQPRKWPPKTSGLSSEKAIPSIPKSTGRKEGSGNHEIGLLFNRNAGGTAHTPSTGESCAATSPTDFNITTVSTVFPSTVPARMDASPTGIMSGEQS